MWLWRVENFNKEIIRTLGRIFSNTVQQTVYIYVGLYVQIYEEYIYMKNRATFFVLIMKEMVHRPKSLNRFKLSFFKCFGINERKISKYLLF